LIVQRSFIAHRLAKYFQNLRAESNLWWLWFVLLPVVPLIAYSSLGLLNLFPDVGTMPRHVYIVVGYTTWAFLVDALTFPYKRLPASQREFVRQELNLAQLLTAWLPERTVVALIQVAVCLAIVHFSHAFDVLGALRYLGLFVLGVAVFVQFGLLFSVLTLMFPNFSNTVDVTNRFLLFVSAVILPLPVDSFPAFVTYANPYYVFVDATRNALLGLPVDWAPVVTWAAIGALLAAFFSVKLKQIEPDVRDYAA
jgi:lipopolysaccharide transport system permease protein